MILGTIVWMVRLWCQNNNPLAPVNRDVGQPAPVVVEQPAPVVVGQPAPVVVGQPAPVVIRRQQPQRRRRPPNRYGHD